MALKELTLKKLLQWLFIFAFFGFCLVSWIAGFEAGSDIGNVFVDTVFEMLKILPCAFILLALFDQWTKRETVERHLGVDSGVRGYLWAILLGGMSIGGLYVAFPVAYSLFRKGASLRVIFSFVGFAGVCRIPMTLFEMSFLGVKFTAVRLAVSIPLMLLAGIVMGGFLERKGYQISE